MMRRHLLLGALLLSVTGCGGAPKAPSMDLDLDSLPSVGGPGLQLYAVLTADPQAMQSPSAVKAMFAAARGESPAYAGIRRQVGWMPGNYALDVTLDFADLPHPQFAKRRLQPMLRRLEPAVQGKADAAKLVVLMRSDAQTLPDQGHLRLAGAAALYAAETHDGVVIDLLARRAYSAAQWRSMLSAPALEPPYQITTASQDSVTRLRTRGNAKLGLPDLIMISPTAALKPARARFEAVQAAMVKKGAAKPGDRLGGAQLQPCPASAGSFDAGCVQITP